MPELPEVETVVSELNRKLKDKKIKRVVVNTSKVISIGPGTVSNIRSVGQDKVDAFVKMLTDRKFLSVRRRAKMLIFDVDGPLSLLVHLKMTGQFIFEDKKQRTITGGKYRIINKLTAPLVQLPSKYTHVIFHFTDGSILYYNDVRQFGYLKVVKDSEVEHVKELQNYGPEPLSKKFTSQVLVEAIKRRSRSPIKLVLMDPTVVAGIGNIYSDEILYHSKVRPDRLASSIKPKELAAIYKYIPIVLKQAIKYKGSSVGDFVRTDGQWGSMGKHHFVYGLAKQPCKRCGTIIKSLKLGGRTSCFCPKEQK
jgi:formamidopyrimidine-DNA glycosylase